MAQIATSFIDTCISSNFCLFKFLLLMIGNVASQEPLYRLKRKALKGDIFISNTQISDIEADIVP